MYINFAVHTSVIKRFFSKSKIIKIQLGIINIKDRTYVPINELLKKYIGIYEKNFKY